VWVNTVMRTGAKITILVDNTPSEGLIAEHGLSFWIETESTNILFDTGQGNLVESNAKVLDVDLGKTDILVLSHGHYDHSGGLPYVVNQNAGIEIYCHPAVVVPRYNIPSGGQVKSSHMPQDAKIALDNVSADRLHWVTAPMAIAPDIGITGPIPRNNDFEDTGGPFFLDTERQHVDHIDDDLALWVKTSRGLIIVVGCGHAGLLNTINHMFDITGEKRVTAIIGGFHLKNASKERLEKTSRSLLDLNAKLVVPCHCVGGPAVESLRTTLGDLVKPGYAGMRIKI
jgi:7,8-dihydropterin-6-yl-methyl-4-(beta-D-ribofuranosyl)aminobenzene 5'-phosphate synthase